MTMQNCQLEDLGGCSLVTLMPQVNDLEWSQSEAMGNTLVSSLEAKPSPSVLVDLTKMEYIGSAMVALIVRIWKTVDSKGGKMVVANQHDMVYEVLKLAGLTKVWTIVDSREEGMKLLGSRNRSSASGGGMGLVVLGAVFVIGAISGLGILLSGSDILSDKIAMIITFVFAALGMITGTLIFAQSTDGKKWMGAGIVLASIAVAVVGVIKFPVTQIMAPPQNNSETDKKQEKEKEKTKVEEKDDKEKTKNNTKEKSEKTPEVKK